MLIDFYGHSAFRLKNEKYEILLDPFLKDNPQFDNNKFPGIKPDYILVSHAHGDHLGDTFELAEKNESTIIAPFELAQICSAKNLKTHLMHIGGSHDFPFGTVKLTNALHGSGMLKDNGTMIYAGNPCGFLFDFSGKVFYFAGDTGLFSDMKLIGQMRHIDYAMLPIGDNFTMGIEDAAKAVEFLKPKNVLPMHYNTFDVINADPQIFKAKLEDQPTKTIIIKPNTQIKI